MSIAHPHVTGLVTSCVRTTAFGGVGPYCGGCHGGCCQRIGRPQRGHAGAMSETSA